MNASWREHGIKTLVQYGRTVGALHIAIERPRLRSYSSRLPLEATADYCSVKKAIISYAYEKESKVVSPVPGPLH